MSWVKENCVSFFQHFIINVLKIGKVPKHVAFVMDGNRRFAKKLNVTTVKGHRQGFDKLSEVLQWSIDLGVNEITVFAFSIENFKRSEVEVNALMDLCIEKFQVLLDDINNINRLGVRIRVVGRLSLLRKDLQVLLSEVMRATKHNNKLQVNIAYAYTGRDEISRAATQIVDNVKNNQLSIDDIDETLVSKSLDLGEPDLLIRTSGEVRLSDFMLWQVSGTVLYFTDVLWPEFAIWNLFAAIIHFQRNSPQSIQQ